MLTEKKNYLLPILIFFSVFIVTSNGAVAQAEAIVKEEISPVANDVLFLVLGKMSLYDQSADGELTLRNHHFVAEIMPKEGRKIIGGTLTSELDPAKVQTFNAEGRPFLAHGKRVMNPDKLHEAHPDGAYLFDYETESGKMAGQRLAIKKKSTIGTMPEAAKVTLSQKGQKVFPGSVDPNEDLLLSWESMPGNTKAPASELEDLIFVLGFDCFGNNTAHSGRPYQGGKYLTFHDTEYVIPAGSLKRGLYYTAIVEQATADVERYKGVPGISTYATLTFVKFQTLGKPAGEQVCPDSDAVH
jgi:hypothetical protein